MRALCLLRHIEWHSLEVVRRKRAVRNLNYGDQRDFQGPIQAAKNSWNLDRVHRSGQRQVLWQTPMEDLGCTKHERQNSETRFLWQLLKPSSALLAHSPSWERGPRQLFPHSRSPLARWLRQGLVSKPEAALWWGLLVPVTSPPGQHIFAWEGKAWCPDSSRVHWMAQAPEPPSYPSNEEAFAVILRIVC